MIYFPFCFSQVVGHIDKVSTVRKCSYISAAHDIFTAKVSGTFKRFVPNSFLWKYFMLDDFAKASLID